jgi:hypothetical protein
LEQALYPAVRNRILNELRIVGSILGVGSLIALIYGWVKVHNSVLEYASTNLTQQVAMHFNDDHVKQTLTMVASNEAANLIRTEINPAVNDFKSNVTVQVDGFRTFVAGMQQSVSNDESQIAALVKQREVEAREKSREEEFERTPPQLDMRIEKPYLVVFFTNAIPIECRWGKLGTVSSIQLGWTKVIPKQPYSISQFPVDLPDLQGDGTFEVYFTYRSVFHQEDGTPNLAGTIQKKYQYHQGQLSEVAR